MHILTRRLTLVPSTEEFVKSIENKYKIGAHIMFHIDDLNNDPTSLGWGAWFVINNEDQSIIGDIGFKGKPQNNKTVEIGYGIIPSACRRGFATEAVKSIINWAFTSEKVQNIVAECLDDNYASIKVLSKLGMQVVEKNDNMISWRLQKDQQ